MNLLMKYQRNAKYDESDQQKQRIKKYIGLLVHALLKINFPKNLSIFMPSNNVIILKSNLHIRNIRGKLLNFP
jgi:hypothetical protein